MGTLDNDELENKNSNAIGRREGEEDRRDNERRTGSDRRSGLESTKWDGVERRTAGDSRGKERRGGDRRRRHSHRRWRKLKKTTVTLFVVLGICFVAALLLTYITGGLPSLIEWVVSKNIEKANSGLLQNFQRGNLVPKLLTWAKILILKN